MPIDYSRYPGNWPQFSHWVRYVRAHGRCECKGQCGLHQPNPRPRRCLERNHRPARWAKGKIVLTVAHLCNCNPPCANPDHVIAACQRCHLRIDRTLHAQHARQTRIQSPQSTLDRNHTQRYTRSRPVHPRRDPLRRF